MSTLRKSSLIMFTTMFALLFLSAHAIAANGNTQDAASPFHGLYAGGLIGVATFDADLSSSGDSVEGIAATGLSNAVFLGSGTVYNNIFIAIEGNLAYHNADFSEDMTSDNYEGDIEESYGINARFGNPILKRMLVYGLAGWQQVNIEVSDNTGWSEDQSFNGVRLGIGVEYQTNQNVFIRGEYNYTLYNEETLTGGGADVDLEPKTGHFQLGLGFRF